MSQQKFIVRRRVLSLFGAGVTTYLAGLVPFALARNAQLVHQQSPRHRHRDMRHNFHRIRSQRHRVVVIDPGHGGRDPGSIGARGTMEKTLTLQIARRLRQVLRRRGICRVVMTRDDDRYVPLKARLARARNCRARLFISLHADALRDRTVSGASIYTLSDNASDTQSAALAEQENRVDRGGEQDEAAPFAIRRILSGLITQEKQHESNYFSSLVFRRFRSDITLLHSPRRKANFVVLRSPDIPSVLIEMGFISHVADEDALRRLFYQKKIANAVADAIALFFARHDDALP